MFYKTTIFVPRPLDRPDNAFTWLFAGCLLCVPSVVGNTILLRNTRTQKPHLSLKVEEAIYECISVDGVALFPSSVICSVIDRSSVSPTMRPIEIASQLADCGFGIVYSGMPAEELLRHIEPKSRFPMIG